MRRTRSTSRSSCSCPRGTESFSEALRIGAETYHHLKAILHERGLSTLVGDEGGFAPTSASADEACGVILEAAERGRTSRQGRARTGSCYERVLSGRQLPARAPGGTLDTAGMIDLKPICARPIRSCRSRTVSVRSDWAGWAGRGGSATACSSSATISSSRTSTSCSVASTKAPATRSSSRSTRSAPSRRRSTQSSSRTAGYAAVISHRSGETEDATIADLAVATGTGQIKTGAPARSDRVASTTSSCGSRRSWARPRDSQGGRHFRALDRERSTPHEDRGHDRAGLVVARDARGADRGGMGGARLNMSHGTHADHAARAARGPRSRRGRRQVDRADRRPARPKAPGRRSRRTGASRRGEECVVAGEDVARDDDLPIAPAVIGQVLRAGIEVLIDDGRVRLSVQEIEEDAHGAVSLWGEVSSHKGVNLPGLALPIPSLDTPRTSRISTWRSRRASTTSRSPSSARRRTCAASRRISRSTGRRPG